MGHRRRVGFTVCWQWSTICWKWSKCLNKLKKWAMLGNCRASCWCLRPEGKILENQKLTICVRNWCVQHLKIFVADFEHEQSQKALCVPTARRGPQNSLSVPDCRTGHLFFDYHPNVHVLSRGEQTIAVPILLT